MRYPNQRLWAVLILLISLFLLSDRSALAQKGALNLSFWNRSILYDNPLLGMPNAYESILHLDFSQDITNYGSLTGWLDGLLSGRDPRMAQWFLNWSGVRVGKMMLDVKLGDSFFQVTNLEDRFINLFHPYQYLRGLSAGLSSNHFNLTVFAGKAARLSGLLGATYEVGDQTLFGFFTKYKAKEKLILGGGYIHTENETDWEGKSVTKKNDILLLDSQYAVSSDLKILGEFQTSGSLEGEAGKAESGSSFRIGPLLRLRNFDFEANYRRIDTDFRAVTEENQIDRDEEGFFSSLRFRAGRSWTLFGVLDSYRDNVARDPQVNTVDAFQAYSGLSFYSASLPDLTLQYESGTRESRLASPNFAKSRTSGIFLQLSETWKKFYPYLRFRLQKYTDKASPERSFTFPSIYLGLRYSPAGRSSLWLEGEIDKRFDAWKEEIQRTLYLRSGLNHSFSPSLGIYTELFYRRFGLSRMFSQIETMLGMTYDLAWGIRVKADFRAILPLDGWDRPSNYWLTLKISRRFDWGAPPRIQGRAPAEGFRGLGSIEGFVYEDRNLNGQVDPEEKRFPGAVIKLEDGTSLATDSQGKFRFSNVPEGVHRLSIEERRIPVSLYMLSPSQADIRVEARKTNRADFPLISGSTISGRIMEDTNGSGKIDPGDKPLKDVLVFLSPVKKEGAAEAAKSHQELILNTYSGQDGAYVFDNILPGEYELSLAEETLPKGAKPAIPLPLRIRLEPGKVLEKQDILMTPRPIINIR